MSGKTRPSNPRSKPKLDARVRRTRDRLGDALVQLLHERPFESILVQDVLDRAGVGRSTFYVHYRDKTDLLLSDAEEFFEHMANTLMRQKEASERVAPVREFFAHVAEAQKFLQALAGSDKIHDMMELGRGHFARAIARRLAALPRTRALPPARRIALAHAFAGALLGLMSWWIDQRMEATPEAMDELYHRMVWKGAAATGTD